MTCFSRMETSGKDDCSATYRCSAVLSDLIYLREQRTALTQPWLRISLLTGRPEITLKHEFYVNKAEPRAGGGPDGGASGGAASQTSVVSMEGRPLNRRPLRAWVAESESLL